MEDKQLFNEVLNNFSEKYPKRNIKKVGTLIYIDDECKFNTDGFNILYNIKRLCDAIEDELI